MQGFKVALLVVIALLLLVTMVDRSREPKQMEELAKRLDSTRVELERLRSDQKRLADDQESLVETMDRLSVSLDAFRRGFEQGVVVGQGGGSVPTDDQSTEGAVAQQQQKQQSKPAAYKRDGKAAEGVSFLLPYDRSSFDEDKLFGEYKGFARANYTQYDYYQ